MKRPVSALWFLFFSATYALAQARAVYEGKVTAATVHRGFFDASLKPALTTNSDDSVRLETLTGNPSLLWKAWRF